MAKARKEGKNFSNSNQIEFPVVEISDAMGWDSGPVKKELKLLQWDFSGAGNLTLPASRSFCRLLSSVYVLWPPVLQTIWTQIRPEVIKLFSCSTQLSTKFQLLIKTKIPTK